MIDVREHIYYDDPKQGCPDVRTCLKDVSYFFIGNGLIQAAIQWAPSGEGSSFGLIVMNPECLTAKRETLTFDSEKGFENTILNFRKIDGDIESKVEKLVIDWKEIDGCPGVQANWQWKEFVVNEEFYCPDKQKALIVRRITIENVGDSDIKFLLSTGVRQKTVRLEMSVKSRGQAKLSLQYVMKNDGKTVDIGAIKDSSITVDMCRYWQDKTQILFHSSILDRQFKASCNNLSSVISVSGKVDASIWQYRREWVRDHSFMGMGLILSGHHDQAKVLLQRLLNDFISPEGAAIDSSEQRSTDEVELDQNGILLYALKHYVLWTGDTEIIRRNWKKIVAVTEFPLKDVFRHPQSGMFVNRREYWERHAAHGIEPGIELMYQVFPAIGLSSAAMLAEMISENEKALYWAEESRQIRRNLLYNIKYAMLDGRGFIKRRALDASIQEFIKPSENSGLPNGVPLASDIQHLLNPDTSAALPIAFEFVPPDSPLAINTLNNLEQLWNQGWEGGGYGRVNMTSEADSSGPWPFPSLFVARAYMETGDYDKVWRIIHWLDSIPGSRSGSWFEMYGDRISPPYAQIGITPMTWAEMITLCVHHIVGIRPDPDFINIRPRLIPGLTSITGKIPIRGYQLKFDIVADSTVSKLSFTTNIPGADADQSEVRIPRLSGDVDVEIVVPG